MLPRSLLHKELLVSVSVIAVCLILLSLWSCMAIKVMEHRLNVHETDREYVLYALNAPGTSSELRKEPINLSDQLQ